MAILGDNKISADTSPGYVAANCNALVPPVEVPIKITLLPSCLPMAKASFADSQYLSAVKLASASVVSIPCSANLDKYKLQPNIFAIVVCVGAPSNCEAEKPCRYTIA